ncbi:AAA domain containing protein [uncultured Caudovirales phage]|uniref:AAA domain containing protein n=1 Tax=uncultured Caudovirales phage TaxID=2100421 RepID=A0A6J5L289_9CAUD|nr:AAA domain containing protein [uncultured Caudovirales phage]
MNYKYEPDFDEEMMTPKKTLGRLRQLDGLEMRDAPVAAQFSTATSLEGEQVTAYNGATTWYKKCKLSPNYARQKPLYIIAGPAGTGKTTLLGVLAQELCAKYKVAFCTFTGKAAGVLKRSLAANGIEPAFCGTIHRLMYVPEVKLETGEVTGWRRQPELNYDFIVVDEGSMVSGDILEDLLSFHTPILVTGDNAQLAPVGEDVSIMANADVFLTKVRRQALENPIVALSVLIREQGDWRKFVRQSKDPRVQYLNKFDVPSYVMSQFAGFQNRPMSEDPLILCGTNKTRAFLNKTVRLGLKTEEILVPNERVICLKNSYFEGELLANGCRGQIDSVGFSANPLQVRAKATFLDEGLELSDAYMSKPQFGRDKTYKTFAEASEMYRSWYEVGLLFDYGYCLTAFKSQGSQARKGIIYVEQYQQSMDEFVRALYTQATRFSDSVVLCF